MFVPYKSHGVFKSVAFFVLLYNNVCDFHDSFACCTMPLPSYMLLIFVDFSCYYSLLFFFVFSRSIRNAVQLKISHITFFTAYNVHFFLANVE